MSFYQRFFFCILIQFSAFINACVMFANFEIKNSNLYRRKKELNILYYYHWHLGQPKSFIISTLRLPQSIRNISWLVNNFQSSPSVGELLKLFESNAPSRIKWFSCELKIISNCYVIKTAFLLTLLVSMIRSYSCKMNKNTINSWNNEEWRASNFFSNKSSQTLHSLIASTIFTGWEPVDQKNTQKMSFNRRQTPNIWEYKLFNLIHSHNENTPL